MLEYAVELDGPEDGAPLLLVHGLMSNRDHWLPNLAALSSRYRTIRLDLPAHGETPMPANPSALSPDRLVDAFERLRERLGYPSWFICGQSVGGALTMRYALHYPERIRGQIFTNANAVLRGFLDEEQMQTHAERVARLRDPAAKPFDRETIHPRLAKRFPTAMRERLVAAVDRMDPAEFASFIDAVMPNISLRHLVSRTSVPTCLINGRFERRFQPLRDWAATAIPNLQIYDIDGGHSVNIEAAEAFDSAALDFLARI